MKSANRAATLQPTAIALLLCLLSALLTALGRWLIPVDQLGLTFPLEAPFLAIVLARFHWRGLLLPAVVSLGIHALAPAGQLAPAQTAGVAGLSLLAAIGAGVLLPLLVRRRKLDSLEELARLTGGLLPVMLAYSMAMWAVLGPVNEGWWAIPLMQTLLVSGLGMTTGIAWYCFFGLPAAFWRFRIRPMGIPLLLLLLAVAATYRISYNNALAERRIQLEHDADIVAIRLADWLRAEHKIVADLHALFDSMPLVAPGALERFSSDFDPAAKRQVIWLAAAAEADRFEPPLMAPALPQLDLTADTELAARIEQASTRDEPSLWARRALRGGPPVAELWIWAPVVDRIGSKRRVAGLVGLRVEIEPALPALGASLSGQEQSIFLRLPDSRQWWTDRPPVGEPLAFTTTEFGELTLQLGVARHGPRRGTDGFLAALFVLLAGLMISTTVAFVLSQDTGRQLAKRREAKRLQRIDRQLARFRENLQESQKLASLGAMVAGITHEVNTPLCTAKLGAENLRYAIEDWQRDGMPADKSLAEELNRTTRSIENNLQRAADLMNEFKRVSADRSSDRPRELDLREYLQQILDLMAPRLKDRRQPVTLDCAPGIRMVTVAGALSQAIIILLENALIHGFPDNQPGHIHLRGSGEGGSVRILLSDDGVGIPAGARDEVFKQFFTSKGDSVGTGLGLYLARNLVQSQLRGQLHLLDTEVGCCFEIKLEWGW